MSIIRAPRPQGNFYVLDKRISEDRRLSWGARGLLVYLLGKPDFWRVNIQHLVNETEEAGKRSGRDAVYKLLDELIAAGYVFRQQPKGKSGLFNEVNYLVRETPIDDGEDLQVPLPGFPDAAEPHTANPRISRTDLEQLSMTSGRALAKHVIPKDWTPDAELEKKLEAAGIAPAFWRELLDEFRLYWSERREKRPGWSATFLNHAKTRWQRAKEAPDATRPAGGRPRGFERGDAIGEQFLREHGIDPSKAH
jgi:hypothetical protein